MQRKTNRKIRISAIAGATALGLVAIASPAFAASPPSGGVAAPGQIQVSIANPAQATVTVGATNLALNAQTNDSESTSAPVIGGENSSTGQDGGGITVDVVSNNQDGYVLDTTSSDLVSGSDTKSAYDLNVVNTTAGHLSGPALATAHLGAAAATLSDPAYPTILSNSGSSTNGPVWTDYDLTNLNSSSHAPAGTDETEVAFFVQPNTLLGTTSGYSATVSFYYVPNA